MVEKSRFGVLFGALASLALVSTSIGLPAEAIASNCNVTSAADSGVGTFRSCVAKIGTTNFESGIYITFAPAVTEIKLETPITASFSDDPIEGMVIDITGPVEISPTANFDSQGGARLLELSGAGTPIFTLVSVDFSTATDGALLLSGSTSATVNIYESTYDGNATTATSNNQDGAALLVIAPTANLFFFNNSFTNNSAYLSGGAVYVEGENGISYIHNDTYTGNSARVDGGAFGTTGSIQIGSEAGAWNDVTTFTQNDANRGGAIYVDGGYTQSNWATFDSNQALSSGGAIYANTGPTQLFDSKFTTNSAGSSGGAVHANSGVLVSAASHFEGNTALSDGGAVYAFSSVCEDSELFASSFFSNSSGGSGGAIYSECNLNIGHSTFYANAATTFGGAVSAKSGVDIAFATMIDNAAPNAKDVKIWTGTGRSIGSVYAGSTASDTAARFNDLMTNTYPGNVSTGLEGVFNNTGNAQGASFGRFELSLATQFAGERCNPEDESECVQPLKTKGFVPSATSTLLGGVTQEALGEFLLNAWDYYFEGDQPGWTLDFPYAAGSVHETYTPDGPEFGGGDETDDSGDVSGDVPPDNSDDVSGDVPSPPPGGEPSDSPGSPINYNFAITGVSHPSVLTQGGLFIAFGVGLDKTQRLYLGNQQVTFSLLEDGSLRVNYPAMPAGEYWLRGVSQDGVAVLHHAIWLVGDLNFKAWTTRSGNDIKIYAKNVINKGKVQFFVDGREIAWINALDESDPKLRTSAGFHYLVRSVALPLDGAKMRIEVKLNGDRVRRNTYTIFGN